MTTRLMTLLIWAAVLAGAVAWGLPLFTRSTPVPPGTSLAAPAAPAGAGLVRLLGQAPAAPVVEAPVVVADSRFRLLGVVAPRAGAASGLALISVDGKPARAVGVGRELEPGLRLLRVGHRQVELGATAGAPAVTLTLPALAEAQRGRPGETMAAMPGQVPGLPGVPGVPGVPGAAFNGVPGAMRVPPMPMAQPQPLPPVQVPQGVPQDASPGSLPYQPEAGGGPTATESVIRPNPAKMH
jgi:general secretion pathway protein C